MGQLFVRFSKRNGDATLDKTRSYKRAARIGNTAIVQDGDDIVAYAFFNKTKNAYTLFVMECAKQDEYARYTKRFIGNSAKWMNLTEKRRKYNVRFVSRSVLNETEFSINF